MNTEISFVQVPGRRVTDTATMTIWAVMVDGKIIAYTDEPLSLMTDGATRATALDKAPSHSYILPTQESVTGHKRT